MKLKKFAQRVAELKDYISPYAEALLGLKINPDEEYDVYVKIGNSERIVSKCRVDRQQEKIFIEGK